MEKNEKKCPFCGSTITGKYWQHMQQQSGIKGHPIYEYNPQRTRFIEEIIRKAAVKEITWKEAGDLITRLHSKEITIEEAADFINTSSRKKISK